MLACVLSIVHPLAAQDSLPQTAAVRSEPQPLVQGTVGWLLVRVPDAKLNGGIAAGEPIHFDSVADAEYRGVIGVPLNASDSMAVVLFVAREDRVDTLHATVAVAPGGYPRETITVAPAFAKPNAEANARIQRENARSRQVSVASRDRPRLWSGPFQLPRAARTTSVFGAARVYNGEVKSRHTGTDFAGAVGTPVVAAGRGVVALVADFYLAGRAVYIDHGGGLVTAYFHLSRADVAQGDTVSAGQRIGAVGQSGRVTGPHLHWVARYGVISVDPMSLLGLEKETVHHRGTENTEGSWDSKPADPAAPLRPAERLSDPPSPCSSS
jgi:murein DD-endopeptidase MepM/ murein hydrolase activator NlpD